MNVQSKENKSEEKVNYGNLTELAIRIYALDTKVYELVGSSLGRTFSGDEKKSINGLVELMSKHPQGYKLRGEIALIGNMARTVKDKEKKSNIDILNFLSNKNGINENSEEKINHFC